MIRTESSPRNPVFGWSSFRVVSAKGICSIDEAPSRAYTTSGRAAIYHALRQAKLPPGSTVLVPSYHCPTMVAPALLAGHRVTFFAVRTDGLPDIDAISPHAARDAKAMIVPHYFGLGQSLGEVREWCDERGVTLIEDCAHSFFGTAGDRTLGAWGDYATASLSKFFPLPEAGLLVSFRRPVASLDLRPPSCRSQLKGMVDVFEHAAAHQRLFGLNAGLRLLFKLKNWARGSAPVNPLQQEESKGTSDELLRDSDMGRIEHAPLLASKVIKSMLPRGRIITQRQRNFAQYAEHFRSWRSGTRPLFAHPSAGHVPYAFPLWVDDANRVYADLRAHGHPVYRWDRIWPATPTAAGDVGPLWSHHVLQLLCHQDLSGFDIEATVLAIKAAISGASVRSFALHDTK